MSTPNKWWEGQRGEWYVVAQMALILLIAVGPATWPIDLTWPAPCNWLGQLMGSALMIAGAMFAVTASLRLGKSLTPLPKPRDDAVLTINGPFRLVRHPIYSGLIIASLGWALWQNGWLTLVYVLMLFVFFDIKSRREERWLVVRYPDYATYRQRVRKLIPFVY